MIRRWLAAYQDGYIPPHALHQAVDRMAAMLARARAQGPVTLDGYGFGPMLGKRTARRWLKELGRRVAR